MTRCASLLAAAGILAVGAAASADLFQFEASDFGVFAGGSLSAGQEVQITGQVGALDSISLASQTILTGALYAGNDFTGRDSVHITGRAMAGESITLGQSVSVGRLDAGTSGDYVRVGKQSTVGAIYSGHGLVFDKDVTVQGSVHVAYRLHAKEDAVIQGGVYAGDDIRIEKRGVVLGDLHSGNKIELKDDVVAASLYAAGDVKLRKRVELSGGIDSGRNVALGDAALVHGGVVFKDGLTMGALAAIEGGVSQGTADSPQAPAGPDSWQGSTRTEPGFSHGAADLSFSDSAAAGIDAGSYQDLWAESDATLNLTAGEYEFRDVWLDARAKIVADTTGGDVVIKASGDFVLADSGRVEVLGDGQVWIYASDDINIGDGAVVRANMLAFDDMWIGTGSDVEGMLYAHDNLGLGDQVTVLAADGGGGVPVPEPGTLALLGGGGMLLVLRRQRRHAPA